MVITVDHAGWGPLRRAEELAVPDENRGHRAPRPRAAADGPGEALPQRTPGASSAGWSEPGGWAAGSPEDRALEFTVLEYIRMPGPEPAGESEYPPTAEVLGQVLDGLRKLH